MFKMQKAEKESEFSNHFVQANTDSKRHDSAMNSNRGVDVVKSWIYHASMRVDVEASLSVGLPQD